MSPRVRRSAGSSRPPAPAGSWWQAAVEAHRARRRVAVRAPAAANAGAATTSASEFAGLEPESAQPDQKFAELRQVHASPTAFRIPRPEARMEILLPRFAGARLLGREGEVSEDAAERRGRIADYRGVLLQFRATLDTSSPAFEQAATACGGGFLRASDQGAETVPKPSVQYRAGGHWRSRAPSPTRRAIRGMKMLLGGSVRARA